MARTHSNTGEPMDLEARKGELFATIMLLKSARRKLAEMQIGGASADDLLPLMDRIADLDSEHERLRLEVYNEVTYRNIGALLERFDETNQRRAAEAEQLLSGQEQISTAIGGLHAQLGALQQQFSDLGERVDDHGAQLATHTEQIEIISRRLDAHEVRLGTLERDVADLRRDIAADRNALRGVRAK